MDEKILLNRRFVISKMFHETYEKFRTKDFGKISKQFQEFSRSGLRYSLVGFGKVCAENKRKSVSVFDKRKMSAV